MVHPGAFGSAEAGVPLDPSWPGLEPDRKQVKVDPDAMENLAEMLLAECDSIRDEYGGGSLKHFGQVVGEGLRDAESGNGPFGGWQSANAVAYQHAQLYDYTHKLYDQLVKQLETAAQALKAAANSYRDADHRTMAALPPTTSGMTAPAAPSPATSSGSGAYGSAGDHSVPNTTGGKTGKTTDFEELG